MNDDCEHVFILVTSGEEKVLRCTKCSHEEPYEDELEDERLN